MAQTGYTPILIYSSSTASTAPAAGNLTNSTLGSELAINITDGKLFYKDNGGSVQVIGWKTTPTTAGGTGLTSYTAGDLLYFASGTTLSKLAIGASTTILTSSGTAPQWSTASGITVGTATNIAGGAAGSVPYQTGAGATSLLAIGTAYYQLGVNVGGTAPAWQPSATSVLTTQGDLLYASAANTLARLAKNTTATRYLSNTGASNNPAWAQIDLTNGVTGTLPTTNGGTGLSSFSANQIFFASSTSAIGQSSNLSWNGTGLGVNVASAAYFVDFRGGSAANVGSFSSTNTTAYSATAYNGNIARFFISGGNATGAANGIEFSGGGNNENFLGFVQESGGSGAFVVQGYNGSAYAERTRIDSSGNLLVGTTSGSNHYIAKAVAEGNDILGVISTTTNLQSAYFMGVSSAGENAAASAIGVRKNSSTSRSINAAGTINASGADYAEYMTKAGDFTIAKGDICGVDTNGKLTNVFADAMSFVVKSTDPSYVGGDVWGNESALGLTKPQVPIQRATTEEVEAETDEEFKIRYAQYESDKQAFEIALETARQRVDRISFAGQVPVNVMGATSGQYIIPVNDNGAIKGEAVSNPTFEQYQISVGKVIAIESDGRAKIIVKVS